MTRSPHAECYQCSRSLHDPVYFLSGAPVFQDRCDLGVPGYPDLGRSCQFFGARYPWGRDPTVDEDEEIES